jgi:hypothetical protein
MHGGPGEFFHAPNIPGPCYAYAMPLPSAKSLWIAVLAAVAAPQILHGKTRIDAPVADDASASVTAAELRDHVAILADDVFEGRAVGTRGGHAAGQYIVKQLRKSRLQPNGTEDGYFQPCERGGRNILAVLPGTDPKLRDEYIVVGAHYDHVGDGRQGHVKGPIGNIYNGADDNASGVAALLESIEALSDAKIETRRSILFAFWDGEEMGMLGSKDWFKSPTVSPAKIRLAFNIDMIGRLREGKLQVLGTRTGYNMRPLVAGSADQSLWLDFSWELTANSDHWPFLERQIPIVMLHTGLHDDYHLPGDDAEKINHVGLETVTRYLLATVTEAANADELPAYRPARRFESLATQRRNRQRYELVSQQQWPESEPPRVGITWRSDEAEPGSVFITRVAAESPAAVAKLALDDRIFAINGEPFADADEFRRTLLGLLDAGVAEFTLDVESRGHLRTVTIHWQPQTLAAKTGT